MSRVVICGGSGLIGRAFVAAIAQEGWEIINVSRHPKAGEVGWDELHTALDGADAVVNLAGRSISTNFTKEHREEIRSSRIESTKAVRKATGQCQNPPKRWIQASAIGYFGDRGEEILQEQSPVGTGFLPEVCAEWEGECRVENPVTTITIVRVGVVIAREGGAMPILAKLAKLFLGGHAGSGNQWVSWVSIEDMARLLVHLVTQGGPELVLACSGTPARNRDLAAWIRKRVCRPWSPPVPAFMIRLVGKVFGPDASLVLDSTRVVPTDWGFTFLHKNLEEVPFE